MIVVFVCVVMDHPHAVAVLWSQRKLSRVTSDCICLVAGSTRKAGLPGLWACPVSTFPLTAGVLGYSVLQASSFSCGLWEDHGEVVRLVGGKYFYVFTLLRQISCISDWPGTCYIVLDHTHLWGAEDQIHTALCMKARSLLTELPFQPSSDNI